MTIDANVVFKGELKGRFADDTRKVSVDIDYVEDDEASIKEWVRQELESELHTPVMDEDFEVTNMDEVIKEIAFG